MADVSRLPGATLSRWEWQHRSACRDVDTEVFYPADRERGASRRRRELLAKGICSQCPVIVECASYALQAREPYGVWGGMSEDERAAALGLAG